MKLNELIDYLQSASPWVSEIDNPDYVDSTSDRLRYQREIPKKIRLQKEVVMEFRMCDEVARDSFTIDEIVIGDGFIKLVSVEHYPEIKEDPELEEEEAIARDAGLD
jgi:hypothetical protein